MRPRWRRISGGAAAALAACAFACTQGAEPPSRTGADPSAQAELSRVRWMDDFLGVAIDARYSQARDGTGVIRPARGATPGGALSLETSSTAAGVARVRLGEERATGASDVRSFTAGKSVVLRARVQMNRVDGLMATVGFVGPEDPKYAIAALYNPAANERWVFEVNNGSARSHLSTTFQHPPGAWWLIEILTTAGPIPTAVLRIDGKEEARVATGGAVPLEGLAAELQLWNVDRGGGQWSAATMQVDYLSIEQDR
ncbi:MAG: hypothetical protein IT384_18545 [Deltaproteobacteria bacterium]|nr:hypothetical protein [Deltaproteobacteria bacterium]